MFGYSVLPGKEDGHSVLVGSGKVRSGRITCVSQIMIQEYCAMRSLVFCSSCDRLLYIFVYNTVWTTKRVSGCGSHRMVNLDGAVFTGHFILDI